MTLLSSLYLRKNYMSSRNVYMNSEVMFILGFISFKNLFDRNDVKLDNISKHLIKT